jgi:hypothetical protein
MLTWQRRHLHTSPPPPSSPVYQCMDLCCSTHRQTSALRGLQQMFAVSVRPLACASRDKKQTDNNRPVLLADAAQACARSPTPLPCTDIPAQTQPGDWTFHQTFHNIPQYLQKNTGLAGLSEITPYCRYSQRHDIPDHGGNICLRNVDTHLPNHMLNNKIIKSVFGTGSRAVW